MIRKMIRLFCTVFSIFLFFIAFVSFYAYVRSFYIENEQEITIQELSETESAFEILKEDDEIVLEDISYLFSDIRICRERIRGNVDDFSFTEEERNKPIMYYNGNLKVTEPYQYIWIGINIHNLSDSPKELSFKKPILSFTSDQTILEIPAEIRYYQFFSSNTILPDEREFVELGYLVDETAFTETKLYFPLTDDIFVYLGEIER